MFALTGCWCEHEVIGNGQCSTKAGNGQGLDAGLQTAHSLAPTMLAINMFLVLITAGQALP